MTAPMRSTPTSLPRRLLKVREAATMLAISENLLRKWLSRGVLPFVKIEGVVRLDTRDIEGLIEAGRLRRPPA